MPTTTALGAWYSSFNPHPARRPDAIRRGLARSVQLRFQSSSGQKAGCNTITRRPTLRSKPFQSSSGLLAGCNGLVVSYAPNSRMGFNPHPARRPDATVNGHRRRLGCGEVSILIRPSGQMQLVYGGRWHNPSLVSILIRPEGRMQPLPDSNPDRDRPRFNPHPAFWPDATLIACALTSTACHMFQSSSGQKAGCNRKYSPTSAA